MTDIPRTPKAPDRSARDAADQETLRAAAKAGYQGRGRVTDISEAMQRRDRQRAEREREAAKVHYLDLDTPTRPQR
ncbi:MAG TPA: hypothetical protein VGH71_03960 [Gammaproteobacteria bacterium]|jgi:hypothetical protein